MVSGVFIMMKYQDILAPQYAFDEVKQHAEYLQTTEDGQFVGDSGYKSLTGGETAGNKDLTLGLTAMTMVILCLTYVYAVEYQTEKERSAENLRKRQRGHISLQVRHRRCHCDDDFRTDLCAVLLQRAERVRHKGDKRTCLLNRVAFKF